MVIWRIGDLGFLLNLVVVWVVGWVVGGINLNLKDEYFISGIWKDVVFFDGEFGVDRLVECCLM